MSSQQKENPFPSKRTNGFEILDFSPPFDFFLCWKYAIKMIIRCPKGGGGNKRLPLTLPSSNCLCLAWHFPKKKSIQLTIILCWFSIVIQLDTAIGENNSPKKELFPPFVSRTCYLTTKPIILFCFPFGVTLGTKKNSAIDFIMRQCPVLFFL